MRDKEKNIINIILRVRWIRTGNRKESHKKKKSLNGHMYRLDLIVIFSIILIRHRR